MDGILHSLELNSTVFVQLAIFAAFYFLSKALFFRPILGLLQTRYQRTVEDKARAEKLVEAAASKQAEYKARLDAERAAARKDYDLRIEEVKREEARILSVARAEAKDITQKASDELQKQAEAIRGQLALEVESIAQGVATQMLSRRGGA